jgi:hypothetical protein
MYNPETLELNFETDYAANEFINTSVQSNNYAVMQPGGLTLELIFDGRMPGNITPIEDQLTYLRQLCSDVNPSRGEPNYLRVQWGNVRWTGQGYFAGRMKSLSYRYTLFDRDATPLRATATLALTADQSIELQKSEQSLRSPPVSVLSVPAGGGGLPLIAAGVASQLVGGMNYLTLAWSNNLDNLNAIAPGQTLLAPAQDGGQVG